MPRTSCTCCGSTWSDGSRRRPRRPSSARSGSGAGVGEARRSRRPPGAAFRDRDHLSLPALEARGSGVGGGGRLRVYTARYMLIVRGKERGQSRIEVEETALSPADVIARVMQAAAERTGDPEPPVAVGPAVWYEG